MQLVIAGMALRVADALLCKIFLKGTGKVDAGLVSDAKEHPEYVGKLVAQLAVFIRLFKRLIPIKAAHQPGDLTHFFGQDGHIGELAEIADARGADPGVHVLLGVTDSEGARGIVHTRRFLAMYKINFTL